MSYGSQAVAKPFRTFSHLDIAYGHSGIAQASFRRSHFHCYCAIATVGGISLYRGLVELRFFAVGLHPCCKVARHAIVGGGVDAVGSEVYFKHIVVLDAVVVFGFGARHCALRQHDDAVVGGADAYLVFGANHAERFYTANFRFLDGKLFVAVVELGAYGGNHHMLSGSNVGGATHYLGGVAIAEVNGGDVKVVAVGMVDAGEHLANHNPLKTAFDGLHFLHTIRFQTDGGESRRHLFGCKVEIQVAFQPVVRYIHSL